MKLSALLRLRRGYLSEIGYFKSLFYSKFYKFNEKPWWTLPCYEFLIRKDLTDLSVIEFGSGASTKFLASRVKEILSFESDPKWHENVSKFFIENDVKNVNLQLIKDEEEAQSIRQLDEDFSYADIFIIDGFNRNVVCEHILKNCSEDAIIIYDDFDRSEYNISRDLLTKSGYKAIEFWGLSFGSPNLNCTAIFYKKSNVLNI